MRKFVTNDMGSRIVNMMNTTKIINEQLQINSKGFDELISDTIKNKIIESLSELKRHLLDDTNVIDDITNQINNKISTISNELYKNVIGSIQKDLSDEQFAKIYDGVKLKIEKSYNDLSDYLILDDDIKKTFDDLLYNSNITRTEALSKLKSIMNKLMSDDVSGYNKDIINNKNSIINTIT